MMNILALTILVIDQLVKIYIKQTMLPGESIPVLKNVFHITYVLNPGAAFGMLENQRWFFILMGIAIILLVAYFYQKLKAQDVFFRYGMMAMLGGAIGNLIDRMQNGLVVDFLDFRIWPVFNIADIGITCGVAVMVYALIFRMKEF